MMIRGISFPDELIRASKEVKLAIFAGAGVSMAAPSNYPDFPGLTDELAKGQPLKRENMDFDRFLGRLEDKGVQVHRRTHEIFSNPDSKPNSLHFNVLKMFPSVLGIRLITTNFDTHFSAASRDLFVTDVPTVYYPELPPARNFQGICYLHGCVARDHANMVLTDRDFGRAYVVDGRAARFLQEIFRYYTVLFVGYSHADPIMYHMARGLPPDLPPRYALTPEGSKLDWEALGIIPLFYTKTPDGEHVRLAQAIAAWEESIPRPTTEHETKVRGILSAPPTPDPHEDDYIHEVIKDPDITHFFTRHARGLEWLEWADKKQLFRPLFALERLEEVSFQIADWFVENFVVDHPKEATSLVARQKAPLHPYLWRKIAWRLSSRKSRPDPKVLRNWLLILLAYDHPYYSYDVLEAVLMRCSTPETGDAALMLFRYLSKPIVVLKEELDSRIFDGTTFGKRLEFELTVRGSEYGLREAWDKVFKPNLSAFATGIEQIIVLHFRHAHDLLLTTGQISVDWDPLSSWRQAIEEHERNQYLGRPVDVLIDAARDLIEWMIEHGLEDAQELIRDWSRSPLAILRRLSIHATRVTPALNADQKLRWLLEKDWLYSRPLKHEVFQLLKSTYQHCQETTRDDLLNSVTQPAENLRADDHGGEQAYRVCELLEWITRADSNCDKAAAALRQAAPYCPDYVAEEQPDFTTRTGGTSTGEISPLATEELLQKQPREVLDYVASFVGDDFRGPTRRGLLSSLSRAVGERFEWGMALAAELKEKDLWQSDLWRAILWSWTATKLAEDQLIRVFSFIVESNLLEFWDNYVEELAFVKAESSDFQDCYAWLPYAEQVIHQLWVSAAKKNSSHSEREDQSSVVDDWTFEALNHRGGKLVHALMYLLAARRREAGADWNQVPDKYKTLLDEILIETNRPAQCGRVFLAYNIPFLMNLDTDWTREKVLPLLDWSKDQVTAEQAWHGFLSMGRLPRQLLPELLPYYESTFPHVSTKLRHFREDFLREMAELCFVKDFDPLKDEWLPGFLSALDEQDRARWSFWVWKFLASSDDDLKEHVWKCWIGSYWNHRNLGKPAPLSDGEKEKMLTWALEMPAHFRDSVKMILEIPAPRTTYAYFYKTLAEKSLASSFPRQVCQLLVYTLRQADKPFTACDDVARLVTQLQGAEELRQDLLAACDQMVRLECENAVHLKEGIERQCPSFASKTLHPPSD